MNDREFRSASPPRRPQRFLHCAARSVVWLAGFVWSVAPTPSVTVAATRPNIVVILADDLGFSDLGCYGGEIETPHLDRLAAGGLRFSQFYNCALCGPSRAAVMTGLYPHQVGISSWTGLLNQRCVTVFELLKRGGYATCAVGRLDMTTADKWHDPANIHRYVERFLGSTGHVGPGHYFHAVRTTDFFRDGEPFPIPPEGIYKTDLITDYAVDFIGDAARGDKPFFLYVAQYAPHWPLHAKPEDMDKYVERYRKLGWDAAREARFQRLMELGLIDSQAQLAPRDARAKPWDESPSQVWEAQRMAAFAGQVDAMDQSVGRIMEAVRRAGVEQNTLVLFLSDNGASDKAVAQLDKPSRTWRVDGTPTRVGNSPDIPPGGPDTFVTAGPAWSNLSNAPFRNHKQSNYEGGIATPCIVSWPAVLQQRGGITHELGHIIDVPATCLDVSGVKYPTEFQGRRVQPLEGKSLLPLLRTGHREGHESICWSMAGHRAVRVGSWKLVAPPNGPWELYDLSTDRTELHDLAAEQPDRVRSMAAIFDTWSKRKP